MALRTGEDLVMGWVSLKVMELVSVLLVGQEGLSSVRLLAQHSKELDQMLLAVLSVPDLVLQMALGLVEEKALRKGWGKEYWY